MDIERTKIKSIKCLGEIDDYVYDLSIKDSDPYFFANDILVHNTDSIYFTAYPAIKQQIESGDIGWSKENVVEFYDKIADDVNHSFPEFMQQAFHCSPELGSIIKGGRELVATKGLYITKKRYAALIYQLEDDRVDTNGKPGKVKAMGLDLKRSDTPKIMQDFLERILMMTLDGATKEAISEEITKFRAEFKKRPGWEKGTPKRVNNMTKFTKIVDEGLRVSVPGHVRASINWNKLRKMNSDNYSQPIMDGFKTIVCQLKPNPMGYTSVAYPIDELNLPKWFKELPFDHAAMEEKIIDQKVDNLLGILKWDLKSTTKEVQIGQFFKFG